MINPYKRNWAISSVVERLLYTQDAVGSNPTSPIQKVNFPLICGARNPVSAWTLLAKVNIYPRNRVSLCNLCAEPEIRFFRMCFVAKLNLDRQKPGLFDNLVLICQQLNLTFCGECLKSWHPMLEN